ncbi:MAG TPA: 1,4-alpha-glucan branching protein domain-containing protein [Gemmatimonadaceae bacterium]|nr:1,4-alpha-glucan branching protein domain-containing protein [Gemmatimonadaceae bacterium]
MISARRSGSLDFVLVLHMHVPHVMRHGRWPHGSDWLMEAIVDSYLPLIDVVERLAREGVDTPLTVNVTPIVATQLADPRLPAEVRRFLAQRLEACDADEQDLDARGDSELANVVRHWRSWFSARAAQFEAIGENIIGALARLQRAGRIELMSSGATHGFLPLLARDESIRLQLLVGRSEHERFFGRAPAGCWMPECAYRPSGFWSPLPDVAPRTRAGIETYLEEAGYRFTVIDSHLASAGQPLDAYGGRRSSREFRPSIDRSPYGNYSIGAGKNAVRALVRDPVTTRQVWSRDGGYPGAAPYLEFHKMRFPGGLQLWSVSGAGVSLGDKQTYSAAAAAEAARFHAGHFAHVLDTVARESCSVDGVLVAPFDAELFGHWWFEGPEFLGAMYRALRDRPSIRPVTASDHIDSTSATPLELPAGSWGRDGDFGFWLNDATAGMWRRMWALEDRFWNVAPEALAREDTRVVLAQAARSLLLAQSSDWEFMISAGEVADYGETRFSMHASDAESLVEALEHGEGFEAVGRLLDVLSERDAIFPNVLDSVAQVLESHAVAV